MNLIVGSTGLLGGEICRRLSEERKPVRALVRSTSDPAKVEALKEYGVQTIQGDVRDRHSLQKACQDVQAVITTVSALPFSYQPSENDIQTVDMEGALNLIAAAQETGVEQFIYTSFTMENRFPLRDAKREVEQELINSGLTYTILRPSFFMEFWLSPAVGFDAANNAAKIYGTGKNPISWISYRDVARFALLSMESPEAHNAILNLGGPEALSQVEAVVLFEQLSGHTFEVEYIAEKDLQVQQEETADPAQQSFAGLMQWYASGDAIDMQKILKAFPLKLATVKSYAAEILVPA